MLIATSGWLYYSSLISNPSAVPLPDQIAGLPLTTKMTGKQAVEEFDMLHNEHFPLTSGAVGIYGDQKIGLWVGGAPLPFMAGSLVAAMHAKIAEGDSLFTPLNEIKDRGRTVYVLEGMGQKHYYFQSQNLVIWLASDPALADQALQHILEAYP